MASATAKTPCITCDKGIGLFKCEGCTQTFCTKHVSEHRQTLHHQLDEIIIIHDSLREEIIENNDQSNVLINYIDEWEQESIIKIQQMAEDTRRKVVKLLDIHKRTISKKLNLLTKRIEKAREEDDFFETDLNHWISTLDKLKQELTDASLSNSIEEDQTTPLIYQLKLATSSSEFNDKNILKSNSIDSTVINFEDIFEYCLNGAKIEDNGQLIVHDELSYPVEVRGKFGYSSGTHLFRLQIEKNPSRIWIFFGIISKSQLMTKFSYESSSAYGWADYDDYFLCGFRHNNQITDRFHHTIENDIVALVLDCTNRKIYYTNERSQKSQQLNIDINICPFPWQFHINICGTSDQVRLLSVINDISLSL
ncbi:unnamed protein product [Rotaria sordida]|uniref:B box-type domain-containing protein n=1 Tax=Rotaria sordida TaxID=392033 RepID=A0A814VEL9_9BILA|nr:unnamed protein product [Rotaria sordida]CAF3849328.1 unnamed protein product [Rotaria sordida]